MQEIDLKKSLKQLERRLVLIYVGSLFLLCGFALFANQVLKNQAAAQATSFIRRMVKIGDLRETIITLSQAKLDYFVAVSYYDDQGKKVFSLPSNLNPKILDQDDTHNALFYGYINTSLFFDSTKANRLGTLVFAYGRFDYIPHAVGLWLLLALSTLPLIAGARRAVVRRFDHDVEIKSELARAELAKKVRHDIRSPLFSIQGLLGSTKNLSARERQILDRIVERIFGIIADLEDAPAYSNLDVERVSVEEIIKEVAREKQLKAPIEVRFRFEPSGFLGYSSMARPQLSRVISNILDNSIDAIGGKGEIEIGLRVALGSIILEIIDSGKGIPPDILPHIFEKKFTHGKKGGSGVGLSSAKEAVEAAGGKISAFSQLGAGALLRVELPIANQPDWWIDKIEASHFSQIVVLDDQETSHDAWRMKLKGLGSCDHLKSEVELERWLASNKEGRTLFLVDFDLGAKAPDGIDVIRRLNIVDQSILVTGNFDDPDLLRRCDTLKLKLLPKPLIESIAIV